MIAYATALAVAMKVLGPRWYAERLAPGNTADEYFVTDGTTTLDGILHENRVVQLARSLLVCQHLPGFREQLEVMKTRLLVGVFHELAVAKMLSEQGHAVEFVVPTSVKGADFDLKVNGVLAVEAKAKGDGTPYGQSSFQSSLSEARKQLPPNGPGMVALRIPAHWGPGFAADGERVVNRFLANSSRTNAILVVWEYLVRLPPQGAAAVTAFRVFENSSPRTPFEGLGRIVKGIPPEEAMRARDFFAPRGKARVAD